MLGRHVDLFLILPRGKRYVCYLKCLSWNDVCCVFVCLGEEGKAKGKGNKEGKARVFIGTARDCSGDERRR